MTDKALFVSNIINSKTGADNIKKQKFRKVLLLHI